MATATIEPPWVEGKRRDKAFTIYLRLSSLGVSADAAARYTDAQWAAIATTAGVRAPSLLSRRIVVEMLAKSERERATCPFCGIGDPAGEIGPRKPVGHPGACSK